LEFVNSVREQKNRLGFAVLLKTFGYLDYFVNDLAKVPNKIILHLSQQLGLDALDIHRYNKLVSVKGYHIKLIKKYYGISIFDSESKEIIFKWLIEQCRITSDYINIVKSCIQKIKMDHFELPSVNSIESLVDLALETVNKEFYDYFDKLLSTKQKSKINELVKKLPKNHSKSELSLLKLVPGKPNIATLNAQIKLYFKLKEFEIGKEIMKDISVQKLEFFAYQGKKYNIKLLRGFEAPKRYTILACFIFKNMEDTFDNIVNLYIKKMNKARSRANTNFKRDLVRRSLDTKRNVKEYGTLSNKIAKNYEEEPRIFKREITTFKSKAEFERIFSETSRYYEENSDMYRYLVRELSGLRKFSQKALGVMSLRSDPANSSILDLFDIVKKRWKNKNESIQITDDFKYLIEKSWREYIFPEDTTFDWRYFEIYALSTLATAIRSGDIWVKGSNEYGSLHRHLLSDDEWQRLKPEFLKELRMPPDKEKIIQKLKNALEYTTNKFDNGVRQNRYVKIRSKNVQITPLDKARMPNYIKSLKNKILNIIGDVELADILMDVQLDTNFCSNFRHIGGWKKEVSPVSNERLLATLHSIGCNLGPAQTDRSTVFKEKQIINTKNMYLSNRNLRNANNQMVNLYTKMKITNCWGDGSSWSADGRLMTMVNNNMHATWNVKYHRVGGMLYTHVGDRYIATSSQLIDCGVFEAEHILDPIYDKENNLDEKPSKIHADTHGQTEMLFGFTSLLTIKLMPRIRNLKMYYLYKPDPSSKYRYIDSIFERAIKWKKIYVALDDMLKICASIRYGKVKSSLILKKMSTYRRTNKIYEGFRELGKAARTAYILEYASSKELRRMVQLACNKSEMWHNFQKFIYFGQSGELRTNDFMEQKEATTALELVCNIVAYWNAKKISEAVQKLREQGEKIKDEDIKFITPLMTRHINRHGKFSFDLDRRKSFLQSNEKWA
jgi:TnpA family transposase